MPLSKISLHGPVLLPKYLLVLRTLAKNQGRKEATRDSAF